MDLKKIDASLAHLSDMVSMGAFDEAFSGAEALYAIICYLDKNAIYFTVLSNLASIYIDIGAMKPCKISAQKGLDILMLHPSEIAEQIGEHHYFYNLSNGKFNLIENKNPFDHTFSTIEELIEVKTLLWKAIKSYEQSHHTRADPKFIVNLGNALNQQFRLSEALACYDDVNLLQLDIPQSWINRSRTLMMLNTVSNSYSIQMLEQVKNGYEKILSSPEIPPPWLDYYKQQIEYFQSELTEACRRDNIQYDPHDLDKTKAEYNDLSDYRKFCLAHNLTLSEHGLYCACAGSARDNLTIPTLSGVVGDFVVPMEMVLNRLKSEFSFARHLYYGYLSEEPDDELLHDSCFSELLNDELLGIDVEKLRTAFRGCFGILDKIGVAICELFDVYPPNDSVSFQSFWQLDRGNRRAKFNSIKNPGLLALYSIATDLNDRKDGEWSFLKKLRNDLEHEFVVIHKTETPSDIYKSYDFMSQIVFIQEKEFLNHLDRLLQLTRSAIFSFVFAVRDKALKEKQDDKLYFPNSILRKDYI